MGTLTNIAFLALSWIIFWYVGKTLWTRNNTTSTQRLRTTASQTSCVLDWSLGFGAIGLVFKNPSKLLYALLALLIGKNNIASLRRGLLPLHNRRGLATATTSTTTSNTINTTTTTTTSTTNTAAATADTNTKYFNLDLSSISFVCLNELYNLGALIGIIGCFVCSIIVIFATLTNLYSLFIYLTQSSTSTNPLHSSHAYTFASSLPTFYGSSPPAPVAGFSKRSFIPPTNINNNNNYVSSSSPLSTSSLFQPFVPGITLPVSHIPILLFSIFIASFIHEIGHAFAALLGNINIEQAGFFIYMGFPGAFVSLSSYERSTPTIKKLRIASAGICHNIILCLIVAGLTSLCTGLLRWAAISSTSYIDTSDIGLVVQWVDSSSSLSSLQSGSIIIKVDDIDLHDDGLDRWSTLLLQGKSSDPYTAMGWCVKRDWYTSLDHDCCYDPFGDDSLHESSNKVCFNSIDNFSDTRDNKCSNAGDIIHPSRERCLDHCSDVAQDECVRVDLHEDVILLTAITPQSINLYSDPQLIPTSSQERSRHEILLLYKGDSKKLWNQVKVGTLAPNWPLLTASLPFYLQFTSSFVLIISSSLAFFNVLPIFYLDGHEILTCILSPPVIDDHNYRHSSSSSTGSGSSSFSISSDSADSSSLLSHPKVISFSRTPFGWILNKVIFIFTRFHHYVQSNHTTTSPHDIPLLHKSRTIISLTVTICTAFCIISAIYMAL